MYRQRRVGERILPSLMEGVLRDGIRTAFYLSNVEVVQVTGKAQVDNKLVDFWFVVGDLSVTFPDRNRPQAGALHEVFQSATIQPLYGHLAKLVLCLIEPAHVGSFLFQPLVSELSSEPDHSLDVLLAAVLKTSRVSTVNKHRDPPKVHCSAVV